MAEKPPSRGRLRKRPPPRMETGVEEGYGETYNIANIAHISSRFKPCLLRSLPLERWIMTHCSREIAPGHVVVIDARGRRQRFAAILTRVRRYLAQSTERAILATNKPVINLVLNSIRKHVLTIRKGGG